MQPQAISTKSPWHFAVFKTKIFAYRGRELTPAITFTKHSRSGHFIGCGVYFMSVVLVKEWVRENGSAYLKAQERKTSREAKVQHAG